MKKGACCLIRTLVQTNYTVIWRAWGKTWCRYIEFWILEHAISSISLVGMVLKDGIVGRGQKSKT